MTRNGDIIAGRYRIEVPIGEGGMGAVFRATHLELGRTVAVKLVRSDDPSEQSLERFLREAKSAASVDHRNVVDVLDFGREQGEQARPYLVMECLSGESFEARLKRPPPPSLDDLVTWIAGALSGLAAIHDAGIIHRDLKPANLFLAEDADGIVPKVLDFGIARPNTEASALTHTMQTLGTPHYMSPEQVRSAKTVDARSDLYAVGVMLYLAITGRLPFDGPSATAVIAAIVTDDPVPLLELRPDISPAMAQVVHRAMARDPNARFSTARSMRQALLDAQAGSAPGTTADRPSFTHAPTALDGPPSKMPPMPAAPQTSAPRARTGRRGFFAMLGVLSMLLVAGLAGSLALQSADAPVSAPSSPAAPSAEAIAAPPSAPASASVARTGGEGRASAGTASSTPTPEAPMLGSAADGTLVAGPIPADERAVHLPLEEIAVRVRALGVADRAAVRVIEQGEDAWLLAPVALEEALGLSGETLAAPDDAPRLRVQIWSASVRANVRTTPDESAELLATIPQGTLVVVFAPDDTEEPPRWSRVVVAEGLSGYIATALLSRDAACVPPMGSLYGGSTWIARARIHRGTESTEVLLLLDPDHGGSLRIVSVDAICRTETLASFTLPTGQLAEVFLTRTAADGDTLVALGRWPERGRSPSNGMMSWSVHPVSDPAVTVLELDIASGQNLPESRRVGIGGPFQSDDAYIPIRIRGRGRTTRYVWNGSALVPL